VSSDPDWQEAQTCLIYADFKQFSMVEARQFSKLKQRLVNHASQAVVNHAGESTAGDPRLTSLFKPKPMRLWQGAWRRPGA
jgi:hypothetical protein